MRTAIVFFVLMSSAANAHSSETSAPWEDLHRELDQRLASEIAAAKGMTGPAENDSRPAPAAPAAAGAVPTATTLRAIFREEGVPEELIYVGLVESGYRENAVSPRGAVGPWQFISETGKRYGLADGKNGDERRDLLKSTRAAARYLRDLRNLLGNWQLALAGYNAGENRVLKAMQQARTTDFRSLRRLLPRETAEYVPRVLAAIAAAQKVQ